MQRVSKSRIRLATLALPTLSTLSSWLRRFEIGRTPNDPLQLGRGKHMRALPLALALLLLPSPALAQPWAGVLDPSRATDWTTAGVVISGVPGIPTRTTICQTLNPGATTAQINSAISTCPAGQVVFLNAGTYSGLGYIPMKANVTLRGAGPNQTKLIFASGGDCSSGSTQAISFCGSFNYNGGVQNGPVNWTAGYAKGTSVITLDSVSGITVGTTVLILDQIDDASDPGDAEAFVNGWSASFLQDPQTNGRGSGSTHRGQQEFKLVTAINGNNVTISPPVHASNWRSGQPPQAWWATTPLRNSGLED